MAAKQAKKKNAGSKQPENAQKSPENGDNDFEGEDTAQTLQGDDTPNLEVSDGVPDTDAEHDPEPDKPDTEPEQKPDKGEVKCSECSWAGPRSKLKVDKRLNRPTYCPKCGTRVYHPVHDKNHGFRQLQNSR